MDGTDERRKYTVKLRGTLVRGLREIVSFAIPLLIAHYQNNPWFIAAKPLLTMFGKLARDNWRWTWFPV